MSFIPKKINENFFSQGEYFRIKCDKTRVLVTTVYDNSQFAFVLFLIKACFFNDQSNNSTDAYFVNHEPVKNISSVDSFMSHLRQIKPNGSQPLDQVFNQVINENTSSHKDKKLLIIILTDGEHYNTNFRQSLLNRKPMNKIFVNIVICTDKIETVNYMNKWDREIFNLFYYSKNIYSAESEVC